MPRRCRLRHAAARQPATYPPRRLQALAGRRLNIVAFPSAAAARRVCRRQRRRGRAWPVERDRRPARGAPCRPRYRRRQPRRRVTCALRKLRAREPPRRDPTRPRCAGRAVRADGAAAQPSLAGSGGAGVPRPCRRQRLRSQVAGRRCLGGGRSERARRTGRLWATEPWLQEGAD